LGLHKIKSLCYNERAITNSFQKLVPKVLISEVMTKYGTVRFHGRDQFGTTVGNCTPRGAIFVDIVDYEY